MLLPMIGGPFTRLSRHKTGHSRVTEKGRKEAVMLQRDKTDRSNCW